MEINLLSGFTVLSAPDKPVPFPTRKLRGLVAYLAMSGGQPQPRDKLASLLWEQDRTDQSRASLRHALSQLRKLFPVQNGASLHTEGDGISLNISPAKVDALRFEQLICAATIESLEEASDLYRGEFLEGLGFLTEPFEEWLMAERTRLHEMLQSGLARLLEQYQQAGTSEDVIRVALRLLRLDSLQEPVHRALIQAYAASGRLRAALRQYDSCRELLQSELGIEPSPETQRVMEHLRSDQPQVSNVATKSARQQRSTERRFLTLMTCTLVDAPALSTRLDPEDLCRVIGRFNRFCEDLINHHDGHILSYKDNAVSACFGYPKADEHSAERAVRAGLAIVSAIEGSGVHPERKLHARISIASGQVVIGKETTKDGVMQETIAGDTPHVVAGLQSTGTSNSVLVAESTRKLLGTRFEYEALDARPVDGFDAPLKVWRVLGEQPGQSRFAARRTAAPLMPMVGRSAEIEMLARLWEQAKLGAGQVVVVGGEPGIGKSRLVEALIEAVTNQSPACVRYDCLPLSQDSALVPVVHQLEKMAGYSSDDRPDTKLDKIETLLSSTGIDQADAVPLIAALLSVPFGERYPPLSLMPHIQKEKTLTVLESLLIGVAARRPLLIVVEDLHWSDPATHEFLERMAIRVHTLSALMIITHRPGASIPALGEPHVTSLTMKRLTHPESEMVVMNFMGGNKLPRDDTMMIIDKADGVPLFIEEMTRHFLEAGPRRGPAESNARGKPEPGSRVPDTLRDLLLERLDRLGTAKTVAQEAAVIGRQFSYALLAKISSLNETDLQTALARLKDVELVYARGTPPNAQYIFKHALVHDASYASLLKAESMPLHERIAAVLEQHYPDVTQMEPEVLAHHYATAGLSDKAITYLKKAGELASQRWAYRETIAYFERALELLASRPHTNERNAQELQLQVSLGQAYMIAAGYATPQIEQALDRARELCEQMGDNYQLFFALLGLWQYYVAKQELALATDIADRILGLAREQQNQDLEIEAHIAQLVTLYSVGDIERTLEHSNQAIAIGMRKQNEEHLLSAGYDGRVIGYTGAAWALWALGYPEQAVTQINEALSTARRLAHPYSEAMATYCAAWLYVYRRDVTLALEFGGQGVRLSGEHGFIWPQVVASILHGWALAESGQATEGIQEIRAGLATLEHLGHKLWRPHQQGLLAQACARAGQTDEALALVKQALDTVSKTGDEENAAELNRFKGELILQSKLSDSAVQAEQCFHDAFEIARRQNAKSWELRATISLVKLWNTQNKHREAYALLAPLYEWFTEGFDSADLVEARLLLDQLSS